MDALKLMNTKLPKKMSTRDLCLSLIGIAFHVDDEAAQMRIYEAVRRLRLLDRAATEAGLLPPDHG